MPGPQKTRRIIPPEARDPRHPDFDISKIFIGSTVHCTEWMAGSTVKASYKFTYAGRQGAVMCRYDWASARRISWDAVKAYFDPSGPAARKIVRIEVPDRFSDDTFRRWMRRLRKEDQDCAITSLRINEIDNGRIKALARERGFQRLADALAFLLDHYEKTKEDAHEHVV